MRHPVFSGPQENKIENKIHNHPDSYSGSQEDTIERHKNSIKKRTQQLICH